MCVDVHVYLLRRRERGREKQRERFTQALVVLYWLPGIAMAQ